jgi:CHAD domain-containing protein
LSTDATRAREREIKLLIDEQFVLPNLGGEPLPSRTFVSTYYDSEGFRLARAGITLRRRVENGAGAWQLKLPRGPARLEIELKGGPAGPPAPIANALAGVLRGQSLGPVATLRTNRSGSRVADAEVTIDSVTVLDERRIVRRFTELEIESVGADERGLTRIARTLRRVGARPADGRPKVLQALGLDFASPAPDPSAPPAEHVQAMLRAQVAAILAYDPAVRLGGDEEDLHQLRVATRRLRAILRAARPMLDAEWAAGLRAELGWLGGALGPVRDLDVLLERLAEDATELEPAERRAFNRILAELSAERDALRATMLAELSSPRYIALLDALDDAVEAPRIVDADVSLTDLARAEFRKLRKAVRALGRKPADEELHATRIRGKRARYAAELAEPVAGKRATAFIAAAKKFQDVVGEHQDAVVAQQRMRALAGKGGPARTLATDRIVEREQARRAAARKAFPAAWKRLEKAGLKAWP